MIINKGWLIMELIDTNGNVILYYGTLVLNAKEKEYKRLSYENMLKVLTDNCYIINNKLITRFGFDLLSKDKYSDIIYQYFIITKYTANKLLAHTNEVILYNEGLDIYLLGVTHFGTSWDYVLTDIKIN